MNFDILYRGLSVDDNKFVFGVPITIFDNLYILYNDFYEYPCSNNTHYYRIKPKTLGEFIGTRDSKKKRIFNDDIVQVSYFTQTRCLNNGVVEIDECKKCVVIWDDDLKSYCLKVVGEEFYIDWTQCCDDGITIIGNIHTTPELL